MGEGCTKVHLDVLSTFVGLRDVDNRIKRTDRAERGKDGMKCLGQLCLRFLVFREPTFASFYTQPIAAPFTVATLCLHLNCLHLLSSSLFLEVFFSCA